MNTLYVSDGYENHANVIYVRENLSELFFKPEKSEFAADLNRAGLFLSPEPGCERAAMEELFDKICDVIAVGYKHAFFSGKIKPRGLDPNDREILIAALIAADVDEDRRFVRSKLKIEEQYALDGLFNFRLGSLKNKWVEISEYVPSYFSRRELKDFIGYLIGEKRGRRVIVDGDKVYDRRFNRMTRTRLTGGAKSVINEVLLSGAGEVEIKNPPAEYDRKMLKEYFGDKVIFKNEYSL